MDGAHDLGGMHGFGPVQPEPHEPVFHHDWERRVLALALAMARPGGWNMDMSRFAREDRDPREYLNASYYEIWLGGLYRLLKDRSLVSENELRSGTSDGAGRPDRPVVTKAEVAAVLRRGGPTLREVSQPAKFAVGDLVRTVKFSPRSHTRLPRYARGRQGVVELVHGAHVFPDSNALGKGEDPRWLYTVRFDGRELWGDDCDANMAVSIDAWEPYLERA